MHWFCAVVCFAGIRMEDTTEKMFPCILLYDSLGGSRHSPRLFRAIRKYLEHEWKEKRPDTPRVFSGQTIPGVIVKV